MILSRMVAQQRALDVRAENIANADTPGFKGESVMFSDYLLQQKGVPTPPGGRTVQMVQDRATWRDFQEGQIPVTLTIESKGRREPPHRRPPATRPPGARWAS